MSSEANETYLYDRVVDGLRVASDSAVGMANGNRKQSDAVLHSKLIEGLRTAESAARMIGHYREMAGQGIAWVRLGTRLGAMVEAATSSVARTIADTVEHERNSGRGAHWAQLGLLLSLIADDCKLAVRQSSDKALIIGGQSWRN
jgi:hypothetical protein